MNLIVKLLLVACLVSFRPGEATAQEMGAGLACDQPAQVQTYLDTVKDDPAQTVSEVNEAFNNKSACILGSYVFIRGETRNTVTNKDGAWTITEILVLAVSTLRGWQRIEPVVWWSAFKAEEKGA